MFSEYWIGLERPCSFRHTESGGMPVPSLSFFPYPICLLRNYEIKVCRKNVPLRTRAKGGTEEFVKRQPWQFICLCCGDSLEMYKLPRRFGG